MSEDFDIKQRTENIYQTWISEHNKKFSYKHSKEDGETLERFYNRINLDERRRKMLDDSKEENHVSRFWRWSIRDSLDTEGGAD